MSLLKEIICHSWCQNNWRVCFQPCGEEERSRLLDRLEERRRDRRGMIEVKTRKQVMVKVRQVRSDEQRDDISKNLFTFGQSFRLEECKQFELINAPLCVCVGESDRDRGSTACFPEKCSQECVFKKKKINNSTMPKINLFTYYNPATFFPPMLC